jgi:preprotein translocase subunit SecD
VPVDAFSEPKAVVVGDPIPVGAYTPLFDGSHIISAQWVTGGNATATETVLSLKLDSTATTEFARWTKAHIGSRLAAVFSGRVLVAPTVEMSVDTGNVILGGKTVLAARAALDKAQVVAP